MSELQAHKMDSTDSLIDSKTIADRTKSDVQEAIDELKSLIAIYDPIELLSRVATFVISGPLNEPTDSGGPAKSETNLEYLISLVTAHEYPSEPEFPSPDVVQRTIELLTTIHMAASHHYMFRRRSLNDSREPIESLSDSFRQDKLHVRGDGYWPHLRLTIMDLLQPHDAKLQEVLGFTSHDYQQFMDRTELELQDRLSAEMVTHVRPYVELMKPWYQVENRTSAQSSNPTGWEEFVTGNDEHIVVAKALFDKFGTPSSFVFSPHTPAEHHILDALTCDFGTNNWFHGRKPEDTFWPLTDSRTSARPILRRAGLYYAFHIPKLQREAYTLIGDVLREAAPNYWEHEFLDARDNYLENEVSRLLKKALPDAEVLQSVEYPIAGGGKAEADIVVLCDDVLMVVECKGARLHSATRRGEVTSVEKAMESTIGEGLNQAERFVRELVSRGTFNVTPTQPIGRVSIDASRFQKLFRVNVTLDLMSPAATVLWELEDAGLAPNVARCWSVSLNDLRVIVDILDQPALFVHYLVRRLDVNVLRSIEARDELDYLMHYVKHGLFFRESNAPKEHEYIMLNGFTEELDQYYRRVQGISEKGPKPKVRTGARTQRMLNLLQEKRPEHWIAGCIELLEFDIPVREDLLGKISSQLRQLQKREASYALSFTVNLEAKQGIALASSKKPTLAAELVKGRCVEHCRQNNLDEIWILLAGVPVGGSDIHVLHVTRDSSVSDQTALLLKQLRFETTEYRVIGPTASTSSSAAADID